MRPNGLIVFDMDSTLIRIECIDEIASLTGAATKVATITERAMRGELDFEQSLRERVTCLQGVELNQFERLFTPIPFMTGAQEAVQQLKQNGWRVVLASGGFNWFAQRVAEALQLDAYFANQLSVQDERLTGELEGEIVDAQAKAQVVERCRQEWHVPAGHVVAVGDGANDALMLQQADVGVAFCAKPALQAVADISVQQHDLRKVVNALQQRGLIMS